MKRVLSFLVCCTLCIGVFAYRPMQVKAVAGIDDAVVGSMALASYLSATGLELSVIEGGAATVTAGLGAVAGEYAAATGVAASGEAVLGSIAAGTAISTAGTIILTAAAVAACAALAYWLYDTYCVDDTGSVVNFATVYSASGYFDANGNAINFLVRMDHSPWYYQGTIFDPSESYTINGYPVYYDSASKTFHLGKGIVTFIHPSSPTGFGFGKTETGGFCYIGKKIDDNNLDSFGTGTTPSFSDWFGDPMSADLCVSGTSDYSIPEIQSNQQMEITIPSAAPGSSLAELVETVPQQIADNNFVPSYTIINPEPDPNPDPDPDPTPDPDPGSSSMLDYVADIWRKIKVLPETISNAVKSVFEPDAALLTEITTTFNNKFGWLETLYRLGEDLLGMTADSAPPVIYIHLEDAEGQFRYGGTEKALDMSWYQPYKEDVDNILSGFMWLSFLWLVFKRASAIIQGSEMVSEYSHDIDQGYHDREEWHR